MLGETGVSSHPRLPRLYTSGLLGSKPKCVPQWLKHYQRTHLSPLYSPWAWNTPAGRRDSMEWPRNLHGWGRPGVYTTCCLCPGASALRSTQPPFLQNCMWKKKRWVMSLTSVSELPVLSYLTLRRAGPPLPSFSWNLSSLPLNHNSWYSHPAPGAEAGEIRGQLTVIISCFQAPKVS